MSAYKYLEELWHKKQSDVMRYILRVRSWEYRQLPAIVKCQQPTRIDKARRMGFQAKQGYVVYRIRVRKGGRKRFVHNGNTNSKPRNQGVNEQKLFRSTRSVAEERVGRVCGNLRVLNSYWVNEDGAYKWFEVIMVDPSHPCIRRDPKMNWIVDSVHKRRECRGLTSAGKKYRGLRAKGTGMPTRQGKRAAFKKNATMSLRRYR